MKIPCNITVYNPKVQYKLTVNRKVTIIRGDSGIGKTYLLNLIDDAGEKGSGTIIQSKIPLIAIRNSRNWERDLIEIENSIIFLDEGYKNLRKHEFSRIVRNSSNYFVIITRKPLSNIPYSIHEICDIKNSGKFNIVKPIFKEDRYGNRDINPHRIITEDSKSGYQFFEILCKDTDVECISSGGKSKILKTLSELLLKTRCNKGILIVADGAAFGNEITEILELVNCNDNILLYLPESFEELLIKSDMISKNIDNPDFIESPELYEGKYFSRELYFEHLLEYITMNTPIKYKKSKLPSCFTKRCCYLQGIVEDFRVPCMFFDKNCKTDSDKIKSILKNTGINFNHILKVSDNVDEKIKIKGFM